MRAEPYKEKLEFMTHNFLEGLTRVVSGQDLRSRNKSRGGAPACEMALTMFHSSWGHSSMFQGKPLRGWHHYCPAILLSVSYIFHSLCSDLCRTSRQQCVQPSYCVELERSITFSSHHNFLSYSTNFLHWGMNKVFFYFYSILLLTVKYDVLWDKDVVWESHHEKHSVDTRCFHCDADMCPHIQPWCSRLPVKTPIHVQ